VHQNSVDIHVYAGKVASSRHHGIKRSAADNDFTGSAGAQPIITQPIVRPQPRPFLRVKLPAKAVSEAGQRNGMESTPSGDDELTEVLRSQRNVSKTGNNGSVESMPSGNKESVQIVSIASEELHNVLPQQPATCPTQEPQKKTVLVSTTSPYSPYSPCQNAKASCVFATVFALYCRAYSILFLCPSLNLLVILFAGRHNLICTPVVDLGS